MRAGKEAWRVLATHAPFLVTPSGRVSLGVLTDLQVLAGGLFPVLGGADLFSSTCDFCLIFSSSLTSSLQRTGVTDGLGNSRDVHESPRTVSSHWKAGSRRSHNIKNYF